MVKERRKNMGEIGHGGKEIKERLKDSQRFRFEARSPMRSLISLTVILRLLKDSWEKPMSILYART